MSRRNTSGTNDVKSVANSKTRGDTQLDRNPEVFFHWFELHPSDFTPHGSTVSSTGSALVDTVNSSARKKRDIQFHELPA